MSKEPDKLLFIVTSILVVLLVTFVAGMQSGAKETFAYRAFEAADAALDQFWEEKVRQDALGEPVHFLQPARHEGDGVTVNARPEDDSLILLSGFIQGENQLRLIRRDGSVVAEWPVHYTDHFPEPVNEVQAPQSDWNVDLHGALALTDGSVVFNYEYNGTVKLSRCGAVVWRIAEATHHSVERAQGGGFWIPSRIYFSSDERRDYSFFTRGREDAPFAEDLILEVSGDGRIAQRKSVLEILMENGLETVLTATGYSFGSSVLPDRDLVHVNKVAELSAANASAFPAFDPGDLVVSLRQYNLVFVVDPDEWRVKWHKIGPWRRQHDPEFGADGKIYIFNNNAYKGGRDGPVSDEQVAPTLSNITRVDPEGADPEIVYGGRPDEAFFTEIRGKHELTPDGGLMITEFEAGRVFEVDADGNLVWEYINRHDEDRVLEVTEARIYPADYFNVEDWSCP